jgi:uncharacterized membrane protein
VAEKVSFRRLVVTCVVALVASALLAILLNRLLPQGGILTQAVPLGLAVSVMLPLIVRYINSSR